MVKSNLIKKIDAVLPFLIIILYAYLQALYLSTLSENSIEIDNSNWIIEFFVKANFVLFFLASIIIWIISTLICHFVALLFDGTGTFKRLLILSSYGYAVLCICYTISLLFLDEISFPSHPTQDFLLNNTTLITISYIIDAGFVINYIWFIFSMFKTHKISILKSSISVIFPVIVYISLTKLFEFF